MSILLFLVGAVAIMAGAAMVGFGIPINEFSFGNTLIGAGATTFMGGLVIVGLGAIVAQLQRVVEALATRPPLRASRPMEPFEQPAGARGAAASSRIPFPPKPKSESREPRPADTPYDLSRDLSHETPRGAELTAAPTLRNPDEAPVAVDESDELPLSPFSANGSGTEKRHEAFNAGWRAQQQQQQPQPQPQQQQPQTAFFDTMWPATKSLPPKAPAPSESKFDRRFESKYEPKHEARAEFNPEPKPEPRPEPTPELKSDFVSPAADANSEADFMPEVPQPDRPMPAVRAEADLGQPRPASEMRAVAILKSGVVDGMGYTLYVDGSIEAELPQGTLRFASINELRSHLEKVS